MKVLNKYWLLYFYTSLIFYLLLLSFIIVILAAIGYISQHKEHNKIYKIDTLRFYCLCPFSNQFPLNV